MGLSLVMKLFTAFLLPVLGGWVLLLAWRRGRMRWGVLQPAAVWSLCVMVTTAGLLLSTVGSAHLDQLYAGHIKHRQIERERHPENARILTDNIRNDWDQQRLVLSNNRQAVANWLSQVLLSK